jgi:hypothetical protein
LSSGKLSLIDASLLPIFGQNFSHLWRFDLRTLPERISLSLHSQDANQGWTPTYTILQCHANISSQVFCSLDEHPILSQDWQHRDNCIKLQNKLSIHRDCSAQCMEYAVLQIKIASKFQCSSINASSFICKIFSQAFCS